MNAGEKENQRISRGGGRMHDKQIKRKEKKGLFERTSGSTIEGHI